MANPAPAKRQKQQDWIGMALEEARRRAPDALRLMAPGNPVLALGQLLIEREAARRATPVPRARRAEGGAARTQTARLPTGTSSSPTLLERLDRSPAAKAYAGALAHDVALLPGAARGLWHDIESIPEGADFLGRLINPFGLLISPPGESAEAQLANVVIAAGDYVNDRFSHPERLGEDVQKGIDYARVRLDPSATPEAETFKGELRRNWEIGLNRGEAAYTVGSLLSGVGELKGLRVFREAAKLSMPERIEALLANGHSPIEAVKLAPDYTGIGHHFIPRRFKEYLGNGPLAELIIEHPLNRLKPEGVSKGFAYKLHHDVDPLYYGGPLEGGGGWSGKRLGWEKHDRLGRLWHGRPIPVRKAGLSVPASAALDEVIDLSDLVPEGEETSWWE